MAMSLRIVLAIAALVVGSEAYGQELTGTLKRIRDTNTVLIGHRDAAIPFSYLNAAGEPIGYSLDLCAAIVREIRNEVDRESIVIKYVPVASEDRIQAVIRGSIDLECGSTTNTRERRQEVSFSPVIFVTGTKMMVRRSVPFRTYDDLKGKRIAVSAGTTNEAAIRAFSASHKLGFDVQPSPDLAEAFERFRSGQADGFGTDEVLLFGFRARAPDGRDFKIVGEYLSY